ncbi:MAG: aldo/keto reductase [Phycisphaerae bacterium]
MNTNPPSAQPRFSPRRELGRTGFHATQLGIGDLADRNVPLEQCVATARRALDAGLNLIDTAPSYENGYSEEIVGRAVRETLAARGGRTDARKQLFLIDKVDHHDQPVRPQVEGSLQRLGLPFTDLFVLHGLSTVEGWHRAAATGGALDQLDACIQADQTRFKGISSHSPDVLLLALVSGRCNVVMFPVGPFVEPRFIQDVLPQAKARGVGTVCFKTFGAGKLLGDTAGYNQPLQERPRGKFSSGGTTPGAPVLPHLSVRECLHYTLTCDPDVALLGMSFPNEQDAAFAAAQDFVPLSAEQRNDIRHRAIAARADKGPCWWNPDPQA